MAGRKKQPEQTAEEKLQQALVPEAEQPYKVPDNWCWTRLGHLLLEIKNGTTIKQDKSGFGYFVTRIESLQNQTIDFNRLGNIVEESKIKDSDWYKINDIALSHINSKEHVGKTALITEDMLPLVHGMNLLRLRFKIMSIAKFFQYFSRSFQYKEEIISRINMAVNQVSINQKQLGEIPIPLPPLAEQQRIVERIETLFAKLDEAKEKLQNTLDTFETRKAAILHKAFTGELTANWRKQQGLTMDSWEEKKLSDVCEKIVCGKTPSGYINADGEIPFLKVYNIVNNRIAFYSKPQYISKNIHENKLKSSILKPNDIIMNIVGPPLRKIAIIPNDFPEWNMNQAIVRFRCKENLFYKYLYYALIYPKTLDEVIVETKGVVGQANISLTQSRNLQIYLPTLDEQTEIVRIIDNLLAKEQQAHSIAQNAIAKIDLIKKSILARAFRGQLATNNPADESAIELLKRVL